MGDLTSLDGVELRGMFSAATQWLERSAQSINTLNVFPVPDGDTGTNMLLTMRAAMEEANSCPDGSATAVARTNCKLLPIDEKFFLDLVERSPHFSLQVMRVLADRLRKTDEKL